MSSGVGGTGFWHIASTSFSFAFVFVMISKKDGGLNNGVVCQQHLPLNGLPKKSPTFSVPNSKNGEIIGRLDYNTN